MNSGEFIGGDGSHCDTLRGFLSIRLRHVESIACDTRG